MSSDLCLGDIAEITMGQSPSGENCNSVGLGLPLLNGPTEFGTKHPYPVQFTTEQKKLAKSGDLLFCVRGSTTGKMNWSDQTYVIGRGIASIRGKNGFPNSFIRAAIESNLESLLVQATGSTFPNVSRDLIASLTIPRTSPEEAVEIASIIEPIDDRIALLRETNATLEAIAQAMFKSWFVDFDPVHAKQQGRAPEGMSEATAALFPDSFEESELGLVPRGWRLSTLGSICEASGGHIQTGPFGSQLHASDYVVAGWPVVMPKDIDNRRVNTFSVARIDNENAQRLSRHRLQKHDIVFSRRGDVEKHALIGEAEEGWICGTGCLLVRPGEQSNSPGFLSLALHQPNTRQWLTQHAVGAIMPNLNTGILSSVPILLASPQILEEFECLVEVLECRISSNNDAAQTLATLRDTLLPRLISGQLRIPDVEGIAI